MSSPRLLVIEGNSPQTLGEHVAVGGTPAHQGYSNLLRELMPGAVVDTCHPGDPAAHLPDGQALEGYDGVAITGSSLHVYDNVPEVTRQIELVREVLKAKTPVFGSCWGLQVLTVAAGGVVRRNPKGRELGFGRSIRLTEAGRKHPMYADKPTVFNAPTVHLDEVETLAPGQTVLACNDVSDVQSAEIKLNGATAWAVQYHPEYPLSELAAIVRRIGGRLIGENFFTDVADIEDFAQELETLDQHPDTKRLAWRHGVGRNVLDRIMRTAEVRNWIEFQVLPMRVKRGRH
ncbi:MAG: type 1 glutamine amidotransferase [Pseudolabrys sp.]|nr:type 1 glutamine amidotransferase [Pseudolabrys sp.]